MSATSVILLHIPAAAASNRQVLEFEKLEGTLWTHHHNTMAFKILVALAWVGLASSKNVLPELYRVDQVGHNVVVYRGAKAVAAAIGAGAIRGASNYPTTPKVRLSTTGSIR